MRCISAILSAYLFWISSSCCFFLAAYAAAFACSASSSSLCRCSSACLSSRSFCLCAMSRSFFLFSSCFLSFSCFYLCFSSVSWAGEVFCRPALSRRPRTPAPCSFFSTSLFATYAALAGCPGLTATLTALDFSEGAASASFFVAGVSSDRPAPSFSSASLVDYFASALLLDLAAVFCAFSWATSATTLCSASFFFKIFACAAKYCC